MKLFKDFFMMRIISSSCSCILAKEKLKEANKIIHGKTAISTILHGTLVLLQEYSVLIGRVLRRVWSLDPVEIINKEHADKLDGEEEIGIALAFLSYYSVTHSCISASKIFDLRGPQRGSYEQLPKEYIHCLD